MTAMNTVQLVPFALKDAPALIETVFPAQKVSFEAQRERKAGAGQTLTALGSYWKGRKPLVLVRSVILGILLPTTEDPEKDLELFEALMAFDIAGLGRRAVDQAALKPAEIARLITLKNPWDYFDFKILKASVLREEDVAILCFPLNVEEKGIRISWKRAISNAAKADVYAMALATLSTYEDRSLLCKRPEEVDQGFLLEPVWSRVNDHLSRFGVNAQSMDQLVEQLGILRYGHRPRVGDVFAGGGSIPFETARMGCDAYASDLNPIACMLNWGNFNIVGVSAEQRAEIEKAQIEIVSAVDAEIIKLGIETRTNGDRAKAYLYCLEIRCPETGYLVPAIPNLVISKTLGLIAKLIPDHANKRFDIELVSGVSAGQLKEAEKGTLQKNGRKDLVLVYRLDGREYRTSIKTIRGDYRAEDGRTQNRLRQWELHEFMPRPDDIFQERLYAIQWITVESLHKPSQITYFTGVNEEDLMRERKVETIVRDNLSGWQAKGLIPDMAIEPGYNTDQPIRERGWRYWHQLFNPRQILMLALFASKARQIEPEELRSKVLAFAPDAIQRSAKLCIWDTFPGPGRLPKIAQVFSNQTLSTPYNWGVRAWDYLSPVYVGVRDVHDRQSVTGATKIISLPAGELNEVCDIFITDPPYADAVHYHEITEFFIGFFRKNKPFPFDQWNWDSRRAIAIKGDGDDFRRGMIDAYAAMANHMPENGMQCVMFTHQSAEVWSDMVGIFWAAGLQVSTAWYIATETSSGKDGAFVQGTVTLMLRKRPAGEKVGFKQRILPAVRKEVAAQIEQMMHLNDEAKARMGEPVFNDADLQMAGYAAALKVLTAYTKIGETDVTIPRPRIEGKDTVIDEIVTQASEVANSLLVPEGVTQETWQAIGGIQRFYLRMLDMESVGASKLDNYQNFAKAFRVEDYTKVMASMTANGARLKQADEFTSRELTDSTEIGPTWLGHLIIAIQQLLAEVEPQCVVKTLVEDLPDYFEIRDKLVDLARFLEKKSRSETVQSAAEVLASRIQTYRLGS